MNGRTAPKSACSSGNAGAPSRSASVREPIVVQPLGADQERVERERGRARVRRVALARRHEREHLPHALAGAFEGVDEPGSAVAEVADAVTARAGT